MLEKTLAKSMPTNWTFADLDPLAMDVNGPFSNGKKRLSIGVRKRPSASNISTMMGRRSL
jgi:hypothetical protein